VESAVEAAAVFAAHVRLGGRGAVLAQPLDEDVALHPEEFDAAVAQAEREASSKGVRGSGVTPFLLGRLADLTVGRTLAANQALIVANARLAAAVAGELTTSNQE
jgi:pseudouridine-5'-phosphate glycosidase